MPPRRIFSTEFAVIIIAVGLLFVLMASSLLLFKPNTSVGPGLGSSARIVLEQVDWNQSTGVIRVLVRNSGREGVTLSGVFLNGTLDGAAIPTPIALDARKTIALTLSVPDGTNWDTHTDIPIKVTTVEGAFAEESKPIYRLWIQSVNWNRNNGEVGAYVYSNGWDVEVAITKVYVNGTLDAEATISLNTRATLRSPSDLWWITLSKTYVDNPTQLTLKVVTADGAFDERTMRPYEPIVFP